jgi:hypothetical protein
LIGAIEGRHAKSNKPANMKQAVTRIAIEMRRIIVFFLQWVPEFLLELDSIGRIRSLLKHATIAGLYLNFKQ